MFEIGDKVAAFGNRGYIKSISVNGMFLNVKFDDCDNLVVFNIDGKIFRWNKKPALKKIKQRKKGETRSTN